MRMMEEATESPSEANEYATTPDAALHGDVDLELSEANDKMSYRCSMTDNVAQQPINEASSSARSKAGEV